MPYIKGEKQAPTAEALMRSRYTAYALGEVEHVLRTHDPESAGEVDRQGALDWSRQATWRGLEIHDTTGGKADDESGEVEFTARYEMRGKLLLHRERSTFRKIDGAWFYVDGEMVKREPDRVEPRPGRNDACPCGSGKKYKKCCGR